MTEWFRFTHLNQNRGISSALSACFICSLMLFSKLHIHIDIKMNVWFMAFLLYVCYHGTSIWVNHYLGKNQPSPKSLKIINQTGYVIWAICVGVIIWLIFYGN